jgi:four helix bundle protein
MLRIYGVILEVLRALRAVIEKLRRVDPDLARQLTRCSASLALNVAEGSYSQGRNRRARYHTALGSAREALACLEVADALGYFALDQALAEELHRVIGTLVKVIRG